MDQKTAERLKQAADDIPDLEEHDVEIDDSYSGRCMFGSETYAIICHPMDLHRIIARASFDIADQFDDPDDATDEFQDFVDNLPGRQDNMGIDKMVFY